MSGTGEDQGKYFQREQLSKNNARLSEDSTNEPVTDCSEVPLRSSLPHNSFYSPLANVEKSFRKVFFFPVNCIPYRATCSYPSVTSYKRGGAGWEGFKDMVVDVRR